MASTSPAATRGVAEATLDWQKLLPPGCYFHPKDRDLLNHYLKRKVDNEPIPIKEISEVNLYDYDPQTLAERYPRLGDNGWYFFTPRNRKYKNGLRPNRAAGNGYWKATGKDKPIEDEKIMTGAKKGVIGYKKALVYHVGKPPNGNKTNWIMHEYTLDRPQTSKRPRDDNNMKLDDWVLCRIYEKVKKIPDKNKQQKDESTVSESVDENVAVGDIFIDKDENLGAMLNEKKSTSLVNNNGTHQPLNQNNLIEHYSHYQVPDQPLTMDDYYSYMNIGYEGNDFERIFYHPKEYYPPEQQKSFVPTNFVNTKDQKPEIDAATSSSQQQVISSDVGRTSTVTFLDASNNGVENNYIDRDPFWYSSSWFV